MSNEIEKALRKFIRRWSPVGDSCYETAFRDDLKAYSRAVANHVWEKAIEGRYTANPTPTWCFDNMKLPTLKEMGLGDE